MRILEYLLMAAVQWRRHMSISSLVACLSVSLYCSIAQEMLLVLQYTSACGALTLLPLRYRLGLVGGASL